MILLLDTTVLIDAIRKRNSRRTLLNDLVYQGYVLATSTITHAELYAGSTLTEEREIEQLLDHLLCYTVTATVGRLGGSIKNRLARTGKTVSLMDALIAATAIEHDLTLMTDNRKDFLWPDLKMYPLPS